VANVSVNRNVFIAILAVAAAALLALSFVLGRESGSVSVPQPTPVKVERIPPRPDVEPRRMATAVPLSLPERPEARPAAALAPTMPDQSPPRDAAAIEPLHPGGGGAFGTGIGAERAAVAAYFDAVERIPSTISGEAESVANEMAAALSNGDTSGLDKMIRETDSAKQSLSAIAPPAPCATLHRESLASLDDALEILRSLKAAMQSPEPTTGLAAVAARANVLRARADAVQREERALRERYGLKR
jgi:hypothetical protein